MRTIKQTQPNESETRWTGDQTAFYGPDVFAFGLRAARPLDYDMPPDFSEEQRLDLFQWLWRFSLATRNVHPGTWPLAVTYVDIFLATVEFSGDSALVLGLAAFRIAELLLASEPHPLSTLVERAQRLGSPSLPLDAVSEENLRGAERDLSEALQYNFRVPTSFDFLRYFQSVLRLPSAELTLSAFVAEFAMTDTALLAFHPALLTAVSVARAVPAVAARVAELSTFSEGAFEECAAELDYFLDLQLLDPPPFARVMAEARKVNLAKMTRKKPRAPRRIPSGRRPATPEKSNVARALLACDAVDRCGKYIGGGSYGKVYEFRADSSKYAVKAFEDAEEGLSSDFVAETSVMTAANLNYVAAGNPRYVEKVAGTDIGFSSDVPFVAMELCEIDLSKIIATKWPAGNTPPVLRAIRTFTLQMLRGLAYIHSVGIVHCDFKPANVLVCDGVAKIADFGIAQWQTPPSRPNTDMIYTEPYRPPEHLLGSRIAQPSSDLWALGCSVVEMVTRRYPFGAENPLAEIFATLGEPTGEAAKLFERLANEVGLDMDDYGFDHAANFPPVGVGAWLEMVIVETLVYDPNARTPAKLLAR